MTKQTRRAPRSRKRVSRVSRKRRVTKRRSRRTREGSKRRRRTGQRQRGGGRLWETVKSAFADVGKTHDSPGPAPGVKANRRKENSFMEKYIEAEKEDQKMRKKHGIGPFNPLG